MPEIEEHRVEQAQREAESTADELEERNERLGDQIQEARSGWEKAQADASTPTASEEWEDTEPDDANGEDPTGFDDPENLDLDEDEDLEDLSDEDAEEY